MKPLTEAIGLLACAAAFTAVLAQRSLPTPEDHFVRTFADALYRHKIKNASPATVSNEDAIAYRAHLQPSYAWSVHELKTVTNWNMRVLSGYRPTRESCNSIGEVISTLRYVQSTTNIFDKRVEAGELAALPFRSPINRQREKADLDIALGKHQSACAQYGG